MEPWTDGWIQTLAGETIEIGTGTGAAPGNDTHQEGTMTARRRYVSSFPHNSVK